MQLRTNNKSSLFLIELIIVILFFSIAGAICVSLFAQSRMLSIQSTQLTMATQKCQNAAEVLSATGSDEAAAATLLGDALHTDGLISQSYDLEGNLDPQGRYQLQAVLTPDYTYPALTRAVITMADTAKNQEIYRLETASFNP